MARFQKALVAGIEEKEKEAECSSSLKEKFDKKEKRTVYVESLPEKLFRIGLNLIAYAFCILGIIVLILPDTRSVLIEVLYRFVEEAQNIAK